MIGEPCEKIMYLVDEEMFKCDCCGLCCRNLSLSDLYSDLDRGDGTCVHYNENTHLCNIYPKRPDKCNIDKMYEECFQKLMSREVYYELNYQVCRKLKETE